MSAWYNSNTRSFLDSSTETVVGALAKAAAVGGWETPPAQEKEWNSSIDLLKESLTDTQNERLSILQDALADPRTTPFSEVILEYDFRRRGLRMDCILLAPGLIVVLEFKRRKITAADKDQAMNYAINLREFHEVTQDLIAKENIVIAPVVVSTRSEVSSEELLEFHDSPWTNVLSESLTSDARHLANLLHSLLKSRKSNSKIDRVQWIQSRFRPSSSILDAAVSLYGQHDVSSISDHALPTKLIEECVEEIREGIEEVRANRSKKIILISGAPGA